ncbi:3-oxoacyl-[acyl-carrier-protein] reductase FabG [Pigmentiphaga humi]|uniref:3-oxoacyl-[acyl-carrier-protein] reductase FabG n=1 Tax=Pigmentiphaga humi TaxID=2478468 RepID=A0A3P4B1B3_9BURK|nr:SDR family oxidoreductase [Pigmentiphaga humi]VCU70074.1 3-oxoacyl-[acyl-carrier-protein] reductase FabG [Pigmentiphaga humi]
MASTSSGRMAVVTGAARGIGAAIAVALARRGIGSVLAVRDPAKAEPARRDAAALGVPCTAVRCDVTDDADVSALVGHVLEKHGRFDVLVNNAGQIAPIARIADGDPHDWLRNLDTNLAGPYRLLRAALPALARAQGAVVNISTGAALTPREGWSAYCSAKAGLSMLTRCVAHEYGAAGVAAYSLQPGVVDTDMQGLIRQSGMNEISRIPRAELAPPERSACVVAWLADERPEDLRGQELSVGDEALMARAGAAQGI